MAQKQTNTPVEIGGSDYETVAASQTAQVLGGAGAKGDFLARLVVNVTTAATSTVTLIDNATSIVVVPANTPIGAHVVEIGARAIQGPWRITTAAGVSVIAVGQFSA